jgi:organic radical activating enzyme
LDFGNILETPADFDVKELFNHESFTYLRQNLFDGVLPEPCTTCSQKYSVGSLAQLQQQITEILMQIEDRPQFLRSFHNYNLAAASIMRGDLRVEHMPVFAVVTCGSACNIRCKFCYNHSMNYHPEPADILKIVDQIHETLVYCQLTGGEPLITKAGRALLQQFAEKKYKFAVRLGTNAQWTDFDLLRSVNLADVQISTDAATKTVYEQVRVGGDFDDLIRNIKKFVALKKEKPLLKISTNYTITSDNYMDIPEACKLYEDLGTFTMFGLVMREKNDPQNIKERPDLYEPFLKKLDEAIAVSASPVTKDKLFIIRNTILKKMQETASPL